MLQPFLPELVEVLDRHGELAVSKEVKDPLCRMSAAPIDRALKTHRQRGLGRPFSNTKPCSLLKAAIPIRTFADWDDKPPRFLEIDLVARCGVSAEWFYLNILSAADVATGWLKWCSSGWAPLLHEMFKRLPFPLLRQGRRAPQD